MHNPSISKVIPDEPYLKMVYRGYMGKRLDLENPTTFNEKIQWLKLHDHNPQYSRMVDKYEAKKYVAEIIGEEYIIPTLGVWEHFDDIDFDSLPDQFVLKCTHDSGGLVICRDKKQLDKAAAKKKIENCLKTNFYLTGREWPYKDVKPRIIAEKYMEDDGPQKNKSLVDYKFFCWNGRPDLLYVSRGLEHHPTAEISFYGMDGREKEYHRSDYKPYHNAVIPANFDSMKQLATHLAGEINCAFVRIDLYSINGNIYFSEITFSPCSGMVPFEPASADEALGKALSIPLDRGRL